MSETDNVPFARARGVQDIMVFADKIRMGLQQAIRDRVTAEVLERIDTAMPHTWIPVRDTIQVTNAIAKELGEHAPVLWHRFVADHFIRTPALRPFATAFIRLMGISPATLVRGFQRVWPTVFKNVATFELGNLRTGSMTVELRDIAPLVLQPPQAYLLMVRGLLQGALEVAGIEGQVRYELIVENRSAMYYLTWEPPRGR